VADSGGPRSHSVLVIGGGFAGVAAAWAARRAGAEVELIHDRAGSSELYSGLADGAATSEVRELASELGLRCFDAPRPVPTREGVVRDAGGSDRAVFDLQSAAGSVVRVLDLGRDDWDAELLAKGFQASRWARSHNTRFSVVRVDILRSSERRISGYDLARHFDAAARLDELVEKIQRSSSTGDAWLVGPWFGLERNVTLELTQRLGCPVGETTSPPGGLAGARFELQRQRLLEKLSVKTTRTRLLRLSPRGSGGVEVELAETGVRSAQSVVLALGGVAAGGIRLSETPPAPPQLRVGIALDAAIWLGSEVLAPGSSLWGASFQRVGLAALDQVGLRVDARGRLPELPAVFACGDLVAGRARTVFEALESGILAGKVAAES